MAKRTDELKKLRKEKDKEIEVLVADLAHHQTICTELGHELSQLQDGMDQVTLSKSAKVSRDEFLEQHCTSLTSGRCSAADIDLLI